MRGEGFERASQNRVIKLFTHKLGYRYGGDRSKGSNNSFVDETILTDYLIGKHYSPAEISGALYQLRKDAALGQGGLYEANKCVYSLLRYGVQVKTAVDQPTSTVHLIDWDHPEANDFAIAEEVNLRGPLERRPDLVLYVNGLAIGVLELKRSSVSIGEGIRQNCSNQKPEFNEWFFATVQFVLAGNDSEGLRYGTIETPSKYFLTWKEGAPEPSSTRLDQDLLKLCRKDRLIELMRDFVLFDAGTKKLPRVHQYFGIKAAQAFIRRREGGILWHTQGSGKSIVMVLLARWILAHNPNARVVIITDRDELDQQIKDVFGGADERVHRSSSGADLMAVLSQPSPRLICSLVHKFGARGVEDFEAHIAKLHNEPCNTFGELFVFVDECHRTQSGKLHRMMKAILRDATFYGFTGTPLLTKDRATTLEVFGRYIHVYKYSEAVADEVVLDLVYEARDVDQSISSQEKVDQWFEAKTADLNPWQVRELKRYWGTMQAVLSSKSRIHRIVMDIIYDIATQADLATERATAMLVASSIYEACRYFELFNQTELKGRCAIITSYDPKARDITQEETGANTETDKQFIYNTYTKLLEQVQSRPGQSRTEAYEERAKQLFVKEPARMKLLIVVDKLLTGFDAPSCRVLYIDKSMQDHGLFQAICRTNRLDGEDKTFGRIVDYKDLFKKVKNAIAVYSDEDLDHTAAGADPNVVLQDRLTKAKERLDLALEQEHLMAESVPPPQNDSAILLHFVGPSDQPNAQQEKEPLRVAYYKTVAELLRAYSAIANELPQAGYASEEIHKLIQQRDRALEWRQLIRLAAGENLDLKDYEADMRFLIDAYIEAKDSRKISAFDDLPLLELIEKLGIQEAIEKSLGKGANKEAVAETIENNIGTTIKREQANDPAFYDRMSQVLQEIIRLRKQKAITYEQYLQRVADLARRLTQKTDDTIPEELNTDGKRVLCSNLNGNVELALRVDQAVRQARPDGWRGVQTKENLIKAALLELLGDHDDVERIFAIVFAQSEY